MPRAGAWCENGAGSAAAQPVEPPESDQSQEPGEAISPPHACDFPATTGGALPGAEVEDYPVAGTSARLESEPLVPLAWPAIRRDDGGCINPWPPTQGPQFRSTRFSASSARSPPLRLSTCSHRP